VALDEEVAVEGEAARQNLDRIATAMGYQDRGSVGALEHLLVRQSGHGLYSGPASGGAGPPGRA